MIYHLALVSEWVQAKAHGRYPWSTRGVLVEDEGFVHCSEEWQWPEVRRRYYSDVPAGDLVLLVIDESLVSAPIVREAPSGNDSESAPRFPHIYGHIEPVWVVDELAISA